MAILFVFWFLSWKGYSLVTTLKEICQHTQNSSLEEMCWIYTSYVDHSGMNTTVSSHLLESPVQSCTKASREEPNHSKDWTPGRPQQVPGHGARSGCGGVWADCMLLPGFTDISGGKAGEPSSEFFFQSHFVSQLVSLRTSSHYHQARAGGMTTSQAWQHTLW